MSDLFPEETKYVLGCQAALVIIPVTVAVLSCGILIGWWLWS